MRNHAQMTLGIANDRIRHFRAVRECALLECLGEQLGLSHAESEWFVSMGAIYVDRRRITSNISLITGQYVRAHLKPKRFPVDGVDWKSALIHETSEFVVARKPPGVPVHATLDNRVENVLHQLAVSLGMPIYITQRLDTGVSGAMVFAKTRQFQRRFNQLLVERRVRKRYRALVERTIQPGRYVHYMEPTERGPKRVAADARSGWLECILRIVAVERFPRRFNAREVFEVEIELETGRTHQIRAQLSAMGCPILGDDLYGSESPFELESGPVSGIALSSMAVAWPGTDGTEWRFSCATPWGTHFYF